MSVKLNTLANTAKIVAMPGVFPAIVDFAEKFSAKEGPSVTLGTLGAALQSGEMGEFYSPVFPRGLRLSTGEEVYEADLDAQRVQIESAGEVGDPTVIVSRHPATIALLTQRWPLAAVFDGNVTPTDVAGKVVAGTLPPFLASEVDGYYPVQVANYDAREGDVDDSERIVVGEPIKVTVS